ncbi:MAG: TldD/PmbA family protein [Deltaproteobacteria bacterium]|nr:TldD/PmbA family protein [Deltaproteobacteria bacterium]
MLSREKSKAIIDRTLGLSKADEAQVSLSAASKSYLRFARGAPWYSGRSSTHSLVIRSSFGSRSGTCTVNQLDDTSIEGAVHRSEQLARLAPEDPEFVAALGPQEFQQIDAFHASVEERGVDQLTGGVDKCLEVARKQSLIVAGYSVARAASEAIGNSNGLFGYHRDTAVHHSQTMRTKDGKGSGFAAQVGNRIEDIEFERSAITAADKAVGSAAAQDLEPGKYTVILEPSCVASLAWYLMWFMDQRKADEGRSFFSKPDGGNRIGEELFDGKLNLYSDPGDPLGPTLPWGEEGVPRGRCGWIKGGKLENLYNTRYWAKKQGIQPVAGPGNIVLSGGSGSVDDLIAGADKAVLITCFFYIRQIDPRSLAVTGLTRDGVFWVEGGKIAHPVTNFRWNESLVRVLKSVEAMSETVRTSPHDWKSTTTAVPGMIVRDFELSSVSDAV